MFEPLREVVHLERGIVLIQNPGTPAEQQVVYDTIELVERNRGMVMQAELEAEIPSAYNGSILRLPSQAKFNDTLLRHQVSRMWSRKNAALPEIPGPISGDTLNKLFSPDIELVEEAQERLLMRGRQVGAVGEPDRSTAPDSGVQRVDDSPIVRAS